MVRSPQAKLGFWKSARKRFVKKKGNAATEKETSQFECPSCGQQINVPALQACQSVTCPACGIKFLTTLPSRPYKPRSMDLRQPGGQKVWWRRWTEHFAVRITLLALFCVAVIWFLVHVANKQDHDRATFFQKLLRIFH